MKKFLSLILAVAMVMSVMSFSVLAEEAIQNALDDYYSKQK